MPIIELKFLVFATDNLITIPTDIYRMIMMMTIIIIIIIIIMDTKHITG